MSNINYDLLQIINTMYDDLYDNNTSGLENSIIIYNSIKNMHMHSNIYIINHILAFYELEYPNLYNEVSNFFSNFLTNISTIDTIDNNENDSSSDSESSDNNEIDENDYDIGSNSPLLRILDNIDNNNGRRLRIRIGNINNNRLIHDSILVFRNSSPNSTLTPSPILDSVMNDVKLTILPEELNKIKIYKYDLEESCKSCIICLEIFKENDEIKKMVCSHIYHASCIDKWLSEYNYRCPICRVECGAHIANLQT